MRRYAGNGNTWRDVVPIPTDGDKMNERNFGPAWEACADRSAYLKRVLPTVHSYAGVPEAPGYPTASTQLWTYGNSGALESTIADGLKVDIEGCTVGDKIQVAAYAMLDRAGVHTKAFHLYADAIDRVNGTPGTQTHIPGARWSTSTGVLEDDEGIPFPVCLNGTWTVTLAGTTRICFAFNGPTFTNGDNDTTYIWEASIVAVRFPVLTL